MRGELRFISLHTYPLVWKLHGEQTIRLLSARGKRLAHFAHQLDEIHGLERGLGLCRFDA